MTFPSGFSQPKPTIRVVPIGAAIFTLNLGADDPDNIVLEASATAFLGSVINLPASASLGKSFKFALVTHPVANPTLDTQYIDIFFPVTRGTVTSTSWRLFSGQRPVFIFGPTGWVTDVGSGTANSGLANQPDVAIGSRANGGFSGVAVGYGADANTLGTALGKFADGNNMGVAVGSNASGYSYGVAVGKTARGITYGVAVGSNATANNYGVSVGYGSNGASNGVAIGYNAAANSSAVAVGYTADGGNNGTAVGYTANGNNVGVAVGYSASGYAGGAALGFYANASASGVAVGYRASSNSKSYAVALGSSSVAQRYRELVKSWDGVDPTLQNWAVVGWYGDTTTATSTELLLGGTANQRAILLANSAYQFEMQICAGVTAGGLTSSWRISGCIKMGATASTTALVGTPIVTMTGQDAGASGWTVAVSADTTNGALKLVATGASTTIRWNAHATLSELRF